MPGALGETEAGSQLRGPAAPRSRVARDPASQFSVHVAATSSGSQMPLTATKDPGPCGVGF